MILIYAKLILCQQFRHEVKYGKLSTLGDLPEWEGFHMPSLYVKSCAVIWQLPEVDLFFHNKF